MTTLFEEWLDDLKDAKFKLRIVSRIDRVIIGNFGDHKQLDLDLYELRFFFGSGFRVYYTIQGNEIVLLTNGGNKASQKKDIKKAKAILKEL